MLGAVINNARWPKQSNRTFLIQIEFSIFMAFIWLKDKIPFLEMFL